MSAALSYLGQHVHRRRAEILIFTDTSHIFVIFVFTLQHSLNVSFAQHKISQTAKSRGRDICLESHSFRNVDYHTRGLHVGSNTLSIYRYIGLILLLGLKTDTRIFSHTCYSHYSLIVNMLW